jgi:hypothetical protein
MRFVENRRAGRGVREFHNLDSCPAGRRPGHLDLGWSSMVRQVGTWQTGRVQHVVVYYRAGRPRRKFKGRQADKVLKAVQEHRSDVGQPVQASSRMPTSEIAVALETRNIEPR